MFSIPSTQRDQKNLTSRLQINQADFLLASDRLAKGIAVGKGPWKLAQQKREASGFFEAS